MNKEMFLSMGFKPRKVMIDSLGQEIYIRELSHTALMSLRECKDSVEQSFVAVISSVCDENGKRIFTEDDAVSIADSMSWNTIQEIAGKIAEISTTSDGGLVK